jgi:hypothetical protein
MDGTDVTPAPDKAAGLWNYRVMVKDGVPGIYEVYYTPDGAVTWFTAGPVPATGTTITDLANDLQRQANALNHEPLDFNKMEEAAAIKRDAPPITG